MSFFYDLNKKLDGIRATPELTHTQLNERDMSRAAKGHEKYGKAGMEALAKAGRDGKPLDSIRDKYNKYDDNKTVDEGQHSQHAMDLNPDLAKPAKPGIMGKIGSGLKKVAGVITGPGDEELLQRLERETGGRRPPRTPIAKEAMSPAKQKSFAALAPPKDKITFADKIAGAKKEVDEMLGDVAAEAMKSALGGGRGRDREMEEGTKDIPGGRRHTAEPGGYGRRDDEDEKGKKVAVKTQRGRGRPKTGADMETGEVMKPDFSAFGKTVKIPPHKGKVTKHEIGDKTPAKGLDADAAFKASEKTTKKSPKVKEQVDPAEVGEYDQEGDMAKDQLHTLTQAAEELSSILSDDQNLPEWVQSKITKALDYINAANDYMDQTSHDEDQQEPIAEKATSKKQQKFMGMVHAAQKGEKPASPEVAKVAKEMPKKAAKDFAATKHKGLPEKKKKEESVEETTTSGSVATAAPKAAKGGYAFGGGIYDSVNREVEAMISESMNINMSQSSEGDMSLTVTATDQDAITLATLLKSAGLGGQEAGCPQCGQSSCGCNSADMVDENKPDWPTNTETSADALQYSGGLNKPKSTGQTTVPVIASQTDRQQSYAEQEDDDIRRMMEMAGVKKAKPDFLDMDKDGDKKEPMKKAVADKEKDKMEESIFTLTNQWKAYKG